MRPAIALRLRSLRAGRDGANGRLARLRWAGLCLLLATICAVHAGMTGSSVAAQAAGASEHEIKAAFLFKFLGYADLPKNAFEHADDPITVAVFNAEDVAADLSRISAGRTIGNRPVAIRLITENDSLTGVQMLFIGGSGRPSANRLVKAAQQRPILIVTEGDGVFDQGGMINFRIVDGKIRFEVSLDAAEKSGIRLSSRLLSVALNVQKAAQ